MKKRSWSLGSRSRSHFTQEIFFRGELAASIAVLVATLSGCSPRMVTVTFPERDGNSEYWVCDRQGKDCHGKRAGDVDPTLYEPGLSATVSHVDCPNGVARLEIVVKGSEILQLGYECAAPNANAGGATGLPRAPSNDADGGATQAPTGLPPEAAGTPPSTTPDDATDAGGSP